MQASRITIFAGHYGSGKTMLAINWAMMQRRQAERVVLCDLDIVNPYFRTADAGDALAAQGIELISSRFANTNVDAPALPAQTRVIFDDPQVRAVIDLGGDDRGALALGRYARQLAGEDYDMLLVLNQYRPLTRSLPDLAEIRREIEAAAKVPFTGIVNNSNLGAETTLADIERTMHFAREASAALGLPLRMTAVQEGLLAGGIPDTLQSTALFPLRIYKKSIWRL